jgi:hypothetical protein
MERGPSWRWPLGLLALGAALLTLFAQAPVRADHGSRLTLEAVQEHVDDLTAAVAALLPPPPSDLCDPATYERTPEEVLADHRAALAIGDLDAIDCNYSIDATLIGDNGIDVGHDQIRATWEFFLVLYGGTQPMVVQQVVVPLDHETSLVRLLFTIDTPCVVVPDGIDTYVIRRGQIHAQTSHAFPVFLCLP